MTYQLVAGYDEAVATPELGVGLVGYGPYLDRTATEVADDLMVRAAYIAAPDAAVLVICCDLIGFEVATSDAIRKRVGEACAVGASAVMLSCTHTHSGPASQQYRAMAPVDPQYIERITEAAVSAALAAKEAATPAAVSWGTQWVEPIGYNRRHGSFAPIDPVVRVCHLAGEHISLFVLSYACHAVTLGNSGVVSADWPGATARRLEALGHRAVVLQGFCGDIDPVTNLNRWGGGTPDDLDMLGRLLAHRVLKAVVSAEPCPEQTVTVTELRVDLPLDVPSPERLEEDIAFWRSRLPGASYTRFMDEWSAAAQRALPEGPGPSGRVTVPVHAVRIGSGALMGLPGEVFCEYGLGLEGIAAPVGFCGGNVGYLPTAEGFADAGDYASYLAPKYYGLFPFRPECEDVLRKAMSRALAG